MAGVCFMSFLIASPPKTSPPLFARTKTHIRAQSSIITSPGTACRTQVGPFHRGRASGAQDTPSPRSFNSNRGDAAPAGRFRPAETGAKHCFYSCEDRRREFADAGAPTSSRRGGAATIVSSDDIPPVTSCLYKSQGGQHYKK